MNNPAQPIRGHYSDTEAADIRKAILTGQTAVKCPRCGRELASSLPMGGRCSRHELWELHCESCLQGVIVEDDLRT